MPYRYKDPGAIYSLCKCARTLSLRWDSHPGCTSCIYGNHCVEGLRDLDHEGEPDCTFCKKLRRYDRANWVTEYKRRVLDPAIFGYTSNHGRAAHANASNVPVANQQQVPTDLMAASYGGEFLQLSGVVSQDQGNWDAGPDGQYGELSYMSTGKSRSVS